MENLTYAEMVAILGQEAADEIMSQREGSQGVRLPYPLVKHVSDTLGNELGKFGEYVYGQERNPEGEGYINVGTNLGSTMEIVICGYAFQYTNYMENAGKNGGAATVRTNVFRSLADMENAQYNGVTLPKGKEAKKAAGWNLSRINVGLVRKDVKSDWEPVIYEVNKSMLYGFGQVLDKAPGNGVLSGVLSLTTSHKKKGATVYAVIDEANSKVEPLPTNFLKDNSELIKEVLGKFKEYVDAKSATTTAQPAPQTAPRVDDTTDSGW